MPGLSSIDGLQSGLKTTDIIDSIMKVERQPAVLMEQQEAETTNIITAFKAFQAKLLALNTQALNLSQRATFEQYAVNVSDDAYLTATANGRVSVGNYDIQVQSVARNHQLASQGFSDQSIASFGTGSITIGVGTGSTKTITIDATNNSLAGIKKAINDAGVGVTATIINDGSKSSPYRLILTADKTGQANRITVSSSLTGTNNLNFTTATFDAPETIVRNSSSTSNVSLGASAAYTGTANKIYTFTVAGSGSKTVGSDNITLNWTDGANSGSIVVTQADSEVDLAGAGADGLKLSLSSGVMYGGDKFQVATFAPLLQDASDAVIAIGSAGGTGSPITITSSTNTFKDVVGGLDITVKKPTDPGDSISVSADFDTAAVRGAIDDFIKSYNDVTSFINKQSSYNSETEESGVLFTEYSLQTIHSSIRGAIASRLAGIDGKYNQLYTLGIRSGPDGQLSVRDSSALDKAIRDNIDNVINLFTNSGAGSRDQIEFVSAGSRVKVGQKLDVDITQAATRGRFTALSINDPATAPLTLNSSNNRLKLSVDGLESGDLVLSEKTYTSSAELVAEIQSKIDADSRIGSRGLTVSWQTSGANTGYLVFQSSTYGKNSKLSVSTALSSSAGTALGLVGGSSLDGLDVVGTINGEAATGAGQFLTGNDKNATTEGLKIKVTLDPSQVISGPEGAITIGKGVAAKLNDLLDNLTATEKGLVDRRIKAYQNQVNDLKKQVEEFDKRLAARRADLYNKFSLMESALSQLSAESSFLAGQFNSLSANWNYGQGSSTQ